MSSQFALAPSVLVRRSSESLRGSLTYGCSKDGMRVDEFIVCTAGRYHDGEFLRACSLSIKRDSWNPSSTSLTIAIKRIEHLWRPLGNHVLHLIHEKRGHAYTDQR